MTDATPFFHPSKGFYRFVVLFFVGLIPFGSYFAYDSLGAIEVTLVKALGVGRSMVGTTYTLYSVAAILCLFFSGVFIDRAGTRKASLVFSGVVLLGTVIVALAPRVAGLLPDRLTFTLPFTGLVTLSPITAVIYVGRFIFGAGSESLVVAQSAIIARWFKGKELAFAFGISLTLMRLGTIFSFNTEELIAQHFGHYSYALWAAVLFCIMSLVCNLIYVFMDKKGEKALGLKEEGGGDKIVFADVKKFRPSFWFVTFLCVTFYSAVFPFTSLSTDFFHSKWGLPLTSGGEGGFFAQVFWNFLHMFSTAPGTTSIIVFASMVFAPSAGFLVDKIGKRASLMMVGALIMIPAHLTMGFTHLPPALPMIALGAAFVLVPAAMWPSVPLIVAKERVGTAFGLMTMVQNIGLATFPWLNGHLRDTTQSYTPSQIMFASLGFVGLIFAILLKRADRKEAGNLERPGEEKAGG
jgi:MFS family permease